VYDEERRGSVFQIWYREMKLYEIDLLAQIRDEPKSHKFHN
jgi:hypothetical protein